MGGGSPEKQNKRKITLLAIYATALLIACLLVVFLVVQIATAIKDKKAEEAALSNVGDGSGSVAGYEASAATTAQVYGGYLLLLDEGTAQKTASEVVLINSARPKNDQGEPLYFAYDTVNFYADEQALNAFNEMVKAFYEKTQDNNLYVRYALNPNSENYDPEFRLGTAFTLNYYTTPPETAPIYETHETYKWLYENCAKYGFIVRYPAEESNTTETGEQNTSENNTSGGNVFRYVGVAHATYMKQRNLTLEEYIELLKTKHTSASAALRISGADGQTYAVYYTAYAGESTEVQIPTQNPWTLSGDNKSGFIITVNRSVKKSTK